MQSPIRWKHQSHVNASIRASDVSIVHAIFISRKLSHIGVCIFLLRAARKFHFPARKMTPRGFEPLLPPWKGGVLTAWPWSLVSYLCPCSFFPVFSFLFPVLCTCFLMQKSSPSRARTYNPSVNSRVLYHWAIEDYSFSLRWNCYSFWLYTQNHTLKSFIRGDNSSFLPSWISPRPISISQLHVLPHFHLWPINLVVFKGS